MASTYLTRSVTSTGNRKTFTTSFWFKLAKADSTRMTFWSPIDGTDGNVEGYIRVDDTIQVVDANYGANISLQTNRILRDTNAWYHIVLAVDTTQATASDRVKLYINGVQETSFSSATYPSQNFDTKWNNSGSTNQIGRNLSAYPYYFDGSMSHFHHCDGYSYDASYFGSTDATTGEWKINTSPSVTYGTNGFFILKDGNSVTDQSGNGNNFTVSGGTLTKTEDCPSNVFATMNSLVPSSSVTFSNGNNRLTGSVSDNYSANNVATIGASSGKWYWEAKYTTANSNVNSTVGIAKLENYRADVNNTTATGYAVVRFDGEIQIDGSNTGSSYWGSNPVAGDIIMFALDMDNGKFYLGKNGTWENSGVPTSGSTGTGSITSSLSGTQVPCIRYLASVFDTNFGNGYFGTTAVSSAGTNASGIGIFEYDVPTGFTALSTKGLNL